MATTSNIPADDQYLKTELDVFIPEVWSDAIKASFDQKLVLGALANDLSSLVSGGGDKIHIPTYADVADAASKSQGSAVNYQTNTETEQTFDVDQHFYTSAMIDDLAKVQSSYELLSKYADSMGYKLALRIESHLQNILSLTTGVIDLDTGTDGKIEKDDWATIYKVLLSNNVRPEDCTMVLGNTMYSKLFTVDNFIQSSAVNNVSLPAGAVGTFMGMNVVHCPQISGTQTPESGDYNLNSANSIVDDAIGGYVVHKDALHIAYSKKPTAVAKYDMDYIAHKMVTDMIYGVHLLNSSTRRTAFALVSDGDADLS
tara:strand:+ start:2847 stop:3788 length:942 start_codon:yes stop_codon:yes gene_type:complete